MSSFQYSYSPNNNIVDSNIELHQQKQHQQEQQPQPVDVVIDDNLSIDFSKEEVTTDDDDTDDNSSNLNKGFAANKQFSQPCSRYFILSMASNCLFVIASCFYLALAGNELDYTISIQDLSDDVIKADDDYTWKLEAPFVEDDYVFETVNGVWVSNYQILYFAGAMCFVISGLIDCIKEPGWLGVVLIMAGCFGLTSAMLVDKNIYMSNVFNSVSVHLFLVEALGLFFQRGAAGAIFANNPQLQTYVRLGDAFWILGTLIDVVLSYYYVFETQSLIHAQMAVFAATLWLACSLIYITATSHVECQGRKQYQLQQQQQQTQKVRNNKSSLKGIRSSETPSTHSTAGGDNHYMYNDDIDDKA